MDTKGRSAADNPVEELVFQALELLESEGPEGLERLCARHPEHASELRQRVEALARAGLVGDTQEQLPESIGEFAILGSLGHGGMGVVYLARQLSLQRTVALKLIRPEHLYFPGARERFQREVSAVARLSHPGIVAIHTVGEERSIPYFAMEAVNGASLAEVLRELSGRAPKNLTGGDLFDALSVCMTKKGTPVPNSFAPTAPCFEGSWPQVATRLTLAIAEALAHAHSRGVLHRDVKPANALLTPEGRLVLLDFGLAALSGSERLTKTGAALGSLAYMSPEQIESTQAVDAQSDVWSAGVTYYELLTLRLPFDGHSDLEVKSAIQAAHPSSPRQLHAGLSPDAEAVCLCAIELDRRRRYPDAEAFAADLRALLELRPIRARAPSLTRQVRGYVRRRPTRALLYAGLFLLVTVGPTVYAGVERRARTRVEDANRRTEAANLELERALLETQTQRDRAERNFDEALEAVDTMLTKVGAERLSNVPRMDEVRRELLESALAFQQRLLEQRRGDPALRAETARAHGRVGTVLEQLARYEDALVSQRAALDALEELARETGSAAEVPDLVAAHTRLGGAYLRLADGANSLLHYEAARDLATGLPADHPDAPATRVQLAAVLYNLGVLHRRLGNYDEARSHLLRALELEEEVADKGSEARRRAPALTHVELGNVCLVEGEFAAALPHLTQAAERLEALVEGAETDPALLHPLGKAHLDRAVSLRELQRPEEALEAAERGTDIYTDLVRDYPGQLVYRLQLANAQSQRAACAGSLGRAEEAEAGLRAALSSFEALAEAAPTAADYRGNVGLSEENLGHFLLDEGRPLEAADSFARMVAHLERALAMQPGHPMVPRLIARGRRSQLGALAEAGDERAWALAEELGGLEGPDDQLAAALAYAREPEIHGAAALRHLEAALRAGLLWTDIEPEDRAILDAVPGATALFEASAAPR
ncbi:MAG: protein kinase [Planctomycetaceae bacterium]|nr:protein kinase [Planctomycetaceae bacterium]